MLLFLLAAVAADDDGTLAERLRKRDPDALGLLYDRYGRLVFALLLRMVQDRTLAEDLVQETFLKVWNRAHLFETDRGSLGAWLLAVARNQGLDYLRSARNKAAQHSAPLDETESVAGFVDIERDLLTEDQARRVRAAFGQLSEQQRRVIELAYFEGLTQTEMAARLGQPLGTVKTWVRTALLTLRTVMTQGQGAMS